MARAKTAYRVELRNDFGATVASLDVAASQPRVAIARALEVTSLGQSGTLGVTWVRVPVGDLRRMRFSPVVNGERTHPEGM